MLSDYDRVGSWLDQERRDDARRVLSRLANARRTPHEWGEIGDAVDKLALALKSADAVLVGKATAQLERMTEPRVDRVAPKPDGPPEPPLHDRMVHLQRSLADSGELERSGRTGDDEE